MQDRRKKYRKKNLSRTSLVIMALIAVLFIGTQVRDYKESVKDLSGEYGKIGTVESGDVEDASSSEYPADILSLVPDYREVNRPAYALNDNRPFFTDDDFERAESEFIALSELDSLGRCGTCTASLSEDMMASSEDRGDISSVHPSGWKQAMYPDIIEKNNGALYNRCHLIAYMFSGLNAEPRNLITGTEYMNNEGMLAYSERAVQNWLIRKAGGGRVLYRVTPVFKDSELVCRGVHIEAGDVESRGGKFHINVFCYNVEPGIDIDYKTGRSHKE